MISPELFKDRSKEVDPAVSKAFYELKKELEKPYKLRNFGTLITGIKLKRKYLGDFSNGLD